MGIIKKWNVLIPQLSGSIGRMVYLYLPDSYLKNPKKRYPVMYIFDGHNVFFDSDATYGKSWGMYDYMNHTKKDLIIVAVECNHEGNARLVEYSPINFENAVFGMIEGKGSTYFNWLIETLKPYMDEHYRTLPDRKNTIIAGSSMGGLMALYGICAYNHIFQRAACLSPSLWVNPESVLEFVEKNNISPGTTVYMDYGEKEMVNHSASLEALTAAANLLLTKQVNLTLRIVPGGEHCEASWERQIPIFMDCLEL